MYKRQIDYAGEAEVSGGTFFAAGPSGMAQSFSESSSQCAILASVSGQAGDAVEVVDGSGETVFAYAPTSAYSSVLISLAELTLGESYTICVAGEEAATLTLESTVTSAGGMGGMGGMGGGRGTPDMGGADMRRGGMVGR